MKKNLLKILCLMLVLVLCLSACNLFGGGEHSDEVTLVYIVYGEESPDSQMVVDEMNKVLKEKFNTVIQPKYVPYDNYSLVMSSGDYYDIILTAEWLQFWDFAKQDAFLEITDDMLKKYAKDIWNGYKDKQLKFGKYNGKRYGLPLLMTKYTEEVYMVRGDLMDKYNVGPITGIESFGEYLGAVTAEPGMIPIEIGKNNTWTIAALWLNEQKWSYPGAQNTMLPLMIDVEDPTNTVFKLHETPEAREYSLMVKDWASKGYWSKTALSNTADSQTSFLSGKSAVHLANIPTAKTIYKKIIDDPAKASWNVKAYNKFAGRTGSVTAMNQGLAISAASKHAERALEVINFARTNEEFNQLMCFGIEGRHYEKLPDNKFRDINMKDYAGWIYGNDTDKFYLEAVSEWPDIDIVQQEIRSKFTYWPITEFVFDETPVKDIFAAVKAFYTEYTAQRYLGFVDDVDKAIATENEKLAAIGIDRYQEELQKQVNEFVAQLD